MRHVTVGPKAYQMLIKLVKHFDPPQTPEIDPTPSRIVLYDTMFRPELPHYVETGTPCPDCRAVWERKGKNEFMNHTDGCAGNI